MSFSELCAGLSILTNGDHADKASLAFLCFDEDDDGYISKEEMVKYMTSVFKVLYQIDEGEMQKSGVAADELAVNVADDVFETFDVDNDGKLSFAEFVAYTSGENPDPKQAVEITLEEARRVTRLGEYEPQIAFEAFALCADENGLLSEEAFLSAFRSILTDECIYAMTKRERERVGLVTHRIFQIFDVDNSGEVDFSELASGLSVLCGGSRDLKAETAFSIYDYDNSGYIERDEMERYLLSVYKVMFALNRKTRQEVGVSAEKLALLTTEECFKASDLDHDGRLSFSSSRGGIPLQKMMAKLMTLWKKLKQRIGYPSISHAPSLA